MLTLKEQVQALTSLINELIKDKYQDIIVQRNHVIETVQKIALMQEKEHHENNVNKSEIDPQGQRKRNTYDKENAPPKKSKSISLEHLAA